MSEPEKLTFQKLGKYEVVDKIGQGSFGVVYKGVDPYLKRQVAIKVCSVGDQDLRRRFFREAEIAGKLQHKNIVTVFAFGLEGEVPYLVQEYLTGEDLDVVIKQRSPLTPDEKLEYLCQIAEGLEYAHEQGVVHRDIKPGNLRLLDDGSLKIMDFGIAKLASAETQLTQKGVTMGTASYLPPEQVRGGDVDHRADVFSYGVLAYELLAYERPFKGNTLSALVYQILYKVPAPLSSLWAECPQELSDLVARSLEKKPERRPAGFGEILGVLRAVRQGIATGRWPALRQVPVQPAVRPGKIEESGVVSQTAIRRTVAEVTGGPVTAIRGVPPATPPAPPAPAPPTALPIPIAAPLSGAPPTGALPITAPAPPPAPPPGRPAAIHFDGDATQPVASLARGRDELPTERMTTSELADRGAELASYPPTLRLGVLPGAEPPTVPLSRVEAVPAAPSPPAEAPTLRIAPPTVPLPPMTPAPVTPAPASITAASPAQTPGRVLVDRGREIGDMVARGELEAAKEELEKTLASLRRGPAEGSPAEALAPGDASTAAGLRRPAPLPAPPASAPPTALAAAPPLVVLPAAGLPPDASFVGSATSSAGSDVYRTAVRGRRRWIGLAAAVLVVAAAGGAWLLRGSGAGRTEAPPPVLPTPPSTTAASALATGVLVVDAAPWATVTEVTDAKGFVHPLPADPTTPARVALPPGRYTVRMQRADGGELATCQAEVTLGAVATCIAEPAEVEAMRYFKDIGWWS